MVTQFSTLQTLNLATVESLLGSLLFEIRAVRRYGDRQLPEDLLWGTFPNDGGFEPMPAGESVIDFATGRIQSPDKIRTLSSDTQFLSKIQSAIYIADSIVNTRIEPGTGYFLSALGVPMFGAARQMRRVSITADAPFNMIIIVGTAPIPPEVPMKMMPQIRVNDTTLTKAGAAGVADNYLTLSFVPQWGAKTLNQASYGKEFILSAGAGQKLFMIRNLGLGSVEVRVQGTVIPQIAAAIDAAGGTGYILDPDIHVAGTGTEFFVAIGAGINAVLETNIFYGLIRLQARVAAANAVGTTARLVIEYLGAGYAVR